MLPPPHFTASLLPHAQHHALSSSPSPLGPLRRGALNPSPCSVHGETLLAEVVQGVGVIQKVTLNSKWFASALICPSDL